MSRSFNMDFADCADHGRTASRERTELRTQHTRLAPRALSGFVVGPQIPRGTGTPVGPELRTPSHAAASLNLFYECCRRDRVHPQRLKACSP